MDGVSFFLCCLSFDPLCVVVWDERGVVEEPCALSGVDRGGVDRGGCCFVEKGLDEPQC